MGITPSSKKTGKSFTDSLWQSLTFSDRVDTGKLNESFKMDRGFATVDVTSGKTGKELIQSTKTLDDDILYYMSTGLRPLTNIGKEVFNITQPEDKQLQVNTGTSAKLIAAPIRVAPPVIIIFLASIFYLSFF